jgi:hypothetical protein
MVSLLQIVAKLAKGWCKVVAVRCAALDKAVG